MHIVVCVKQVPSVAALSLDPQTKRLRREGVPLEVNSFDARAIVRAVELRTQGLASQVTALTLGPPQARKALEYCLALGADRAVHLCDPIFAGSDVLATARALAVVLRQEKPDLVLCGRYSVDAETAQLGPELATLLNLPFFAHVLRLAIEGPGSNALLVDCETDYGTLTVRALLPALVTVTESIATERYPSKAEQEAAASRPTITLSSRDLGVSAGWVGEEGSPTRVHDLLELPVQRKQLVLPGQELEQDVRTLVNLLVEECGLFGAWRVNPPPALATIPQRCTPQTNGRILVIGETLPSGTPRVTKELVGHARRLADALSGTVGLLLPEPPSDPVASSDWARLGVDDLFVCRGLLPEGTAVFLPGLYAEAISEVIDLWRPEAVLAPSTSLSRNALAVVAARKSLGLTADCIDIGLDDNGQLLQYKPAFGGAVAAIITSRTLPAMATVRPGVFPVPTGNASRSCISHRITCSRPPEGFNITQWLELPGSGGALDEAEIVVGVGKGVQPEDITLIRELAAQLQAPLCTTRDVADEGWLPRHLQVGLTGRSIAPKLYLAVGIRGAFEHVVGFRRAGVVVAINKNSRAPIFRHCDYGIVADYRQAVPTLVAVLKDLQHRRSR